jgi:hypothetical protein
MLFALAALGSTGRAIAQAPSLPPPSGAPIDPEEAKKVAAAVVSEVARDQDLGSLKTWPG